MSRPWVPFLLAVATAWAPAVQGWSADTHRAVAQIAQARLTPTARAKLELLGIRDLASVAACADEIRRYWDERDEGKPARLRPACEAVFPDPPRDTDRWHYVDIDADNPGPTRSEIRASCRGDACVIRQIPSHAGVLADARSSQAARARAAAFLIHLVADIHQPLHCAERDDDGGGGRVSVRLGRAREQSLHGLWDSEIPRRIGASGTAIAARVQDEVAEAARKPRTELQTWVLDWAQESHSVARTVAYAGVPPGRRRRVVELPEEYATVARDAAKTRIALAGVRLATVLNEALK